MISKYLNTISNLKGRLKQGDVVKNMSWLFLDKIFRVGLNFALMVWIAKYLGPQHFGLWNYAIAFVALFSFLSTLGLDNVVIKEFIQHKENKNNILGAAFILKLLGGILAILFAVLFIMLVRPGEENVFILVSIIASGFVFQSFDVIDFYFQSQLKARLTVVARNGAFLLCSVIKIILLLNNGKLLHFVLVNVLELMLTAVFLVITFTVKDSTLKNWRIEKDSVVSLLKNSLPLTFAGMVILIYMRIDQIMLGQMVGDRIVGIYSAAVRLSEAWWFIPLIITNSLLPSIVKAKKESAEAFQNQVQKSLLITASLGFGTAILISFFAPLIIYVLYDTAYAPAAPILAIHTWTSVFVFMGFATSNWFISENLQKFVLYRTLAGAVINLIFNFLLIPSYAGIGAAIATLIAQFVSSYLFNLFTSRTYPIFRMQSIALLKITGIYSLFQFIRRKS